MHLCAAHGNRNVADHLKERFCRVVLIAAGGERTGPPLSGLSLDFAASCMLNAVQSHLALQSITHKRSVVHLSMGAACTHCLQLIMMV